MSTTTTIHGIHAVLSALRNDPQHVQGLWYDAARRDKRLRELLALAEACGVSVHASSADDLDRRAGSHRHQGVLARYQAPSSGLTEADLERVLDESGPAPLLLVLDGVSDPHNLGACLRTAEAAGVAAVIAPRDKAVGLTPVVRKVACGAAEVLPFVQVTNLARCLDGLKARGIWVVGAAGEGERTLFEAALDGPLALVLGAEGKGLRRLTRERCDVLVHIPMLGQVESLNVSVATGVCLYEALRQRRTQSAVDS